MATPTDGDKLSFFARIALTQGVLQSTSTPAVSSPIYRSDELSPSQGRIPGAGSNCSSHIALPKAAVSKQSRLTNGTSHSAPRTIATPLTPAQVPPAQETPPQLISAPLIPAQVRPAQLTSAPLTPAQIRPAQTQNGIHAARAAALQSPQKSETDTDAAAKAASAFELAALFTKARSMELDKNLAAETFGKTEPTPAPTILAATILGLQNPQGILKRKEPSEGSEKEKASEQKKKLRWTTGTVKVFNSGKPETKGGQMDIAKGLEKTAKEKQSEVKKPTEKETSGKAKPSIAKDQAKAGKAETSKSKDKSTKDKDLKDKPAKEKDLKEKATQNKSTPNKAKTTAPKTKPKAKTKAKKTLYKSVCLDSKGQINTDGDRNLSPKTSSFSGKDFENLKKFAAKGDAAALYDLAICYHYGYHIKRDYDKSFELLQKSAEKDFAAAHWMLADYYTKFVKQSTKHLPKEQQTREMRLKMAFKLYQKAAVKGLALGFEGMADLIDNVQFNDIDFPISSIPSLVDGNTELSHEELIFLWYRKAADLGSAISQYNTYLLLKNEEGIPMSLLNDKTERIKLAADYCLKATNQGLEKAKEELAAIQHLRYRAIEQSKNPTVLDPTPLKRAKLEKDSMTNEFVLKDQKSAAMLADVKTEQDTSDEPIKSDLSIKHRPNSPVIQKLHKEFREISETDPTLLPSLAEATPRNVKKEEIPTPATTPGKVPMLLEDLMRQYCENEEILEELQKELRSISKDQSAVQEKYSATAIFIEKRKKLQEDAKEKQKSLEQEELSLMKSLGLERVNPEEPGSPAAQSSQSQDLLTLSIVDLRRTTSQPIPASNFVEKPLRYSEASINVADPAQHEKLSCDRLNRKVKAQRLEIEGEHQTLSELKKNLKEQMLMLEPQENILADLNKELLKLDHALFNLDYSIDNLKAKILAKEKENEFQGFLPSFQVLSSSRKRRRLSDILNTEEQEPAVANKAAKTEEGQSASNSLNEKRT